MSIYSVNILSVCLSVMLQKATYGCFHPCFSIIPSDTLWWTWSWMEEMRYTLLDVQNYINAKFFVTYYFFSNIYFYNLVNWFYLLTFWRFYLSSFFYTISSLFFQSNLLFILTIEQRHRRNPYTALAEQIHPPLIFDYFLFLSLF